MLERNTASQKLELFAFDYATGAPKTGDAANLTAYVSIDDGVLTALTDTSATEISSTNAPGWYRFDLTQAETNGKKLHFTGKSSTASVSVVGRVVGTVPAYFSQAALDSSGRVTVGSIAAGAVTAAAIATDAIDADAIAADAITEIQSGLSTLNAAGVRSAIGMASANLDTQLTAIDDFLDTEIAAIKLQTDLIPANPAAVGSAMTLADGAITAAKIATGAIDADALAADAVAEIADGVWDEALSGHSTAGSAGDALTDASAGSGGGSAELSLARSIELSLGPDDTSEVFELVQGDVYTLYATVRDNGGDPVNLTGNTITGKVTNSTNTEIDAPTCAIVTAAHGIVSIAITTDVTASALALGYLSVKLENGGVIMTTTPRRIKVTAR